MTECDMDDCNVQARCEDDSGRRPLKPWSHVEETRLLKRWMIRYWNGVVMGLTNE